MKHVVKNFLLLTLMVAASGLAVAMRPTQKKADMAPPVKLESLIPKTFGEWREEPQNQTLIVDPQQKELIDRIYTQTLSRTYVNPDGYRVMLSIAYGNDQSDTKQVHKPEVCYPAQGFTLKNKQHALLETELGVIPVTRMQTRLGQRNEPVTYWITVGDYVVSSSMEKKLTEMRYGLNGQIPDGLLVRFSSIDTEVTRAFEMQRKFASQMLMEIESDYRYRFSGLVDRH